MEHIEETLRSLATPIAWLSVVGAAALLYSWDWPGSRRPDMPPGPRPLPIIGNLHNLKTTNVYENFRQLSREYGPIVSLKVGSDTLILLGGDGSQVRELYDKRGNIYSGRPLQMVTEITGSGDDLLFQQDIHKWRAERKQIVQHFAPGVMKTENVPLQEAESVQLLYEFLHQPEGFMNHPMRYTTSVITCLLYGLRCESYHDPIVQEVEETMRLLSNLLVPGGKPPVEVFPFLNYLPRFISPWKDQCQKLAKRMDVLYGDLAELGVHRGMQGLNTNNLAYKLRLGSGSNNLTRHQQDFTCSVALQGGTDIVAAVILTCLLALISHPVAQKRAHDELDTLYDDETLPRWQDEQALPFVRAIVKETMRWRPPLPMTVPHRLEQDDYYEGYFLPKGSQLFCAAWTIHTNVERYEEPEIFRPERYLDHSMSMAESLAQGDPLKRDHFAFGAGRRVCPGIQKAEQDIFIAISRLLWAFDFSVPTGVSVSTDYSTAFVGEGIRIPKKFPLVITPRSQKRVRTIEEAMRSAGEIFSQYGKYVPT
ncbi:O-methylsterigmatocystin oxidoreductase OS=Aspergillus flavus (strain ATCC 200026 / FGSC A1120 / NRRL 3357 / JCM 12722 / SRRC 167) GN=ordA PE=2 SV=1 [Rhizoctonia solani AG-1 IB]|uniref:O-methylsterigmatocystin oxidoreductase n=1 Tax=Thanatephorus cucumeris (strain AG1-IB / isolate 7/3/14) TaxID=1108050 RepID=A0A0B7FN31_THACB|nr:O-methylsterigmatocystin oxidoreductase OS=Aspergillus flavus (strain ATCC 200026 / FGSC A1120 / NRRL 3357 / JCM 12722 / SRRC 167) GN=ordA PE=2 SV=1 [Rhizoctonia solani AG-1 IB]